MRALLVELAPKAVEGPLLGSRVARGRLSRLFLQRPAHPLMAAVVLGMARAAAGLGAKEERATNTATIPAGQPRRRGEAALVPVAQAVTCMVSPDFEVFQCVRR